jgi:hypothetical protein
VESEPARMIESTALHIAAVGLIRNLAFGAGKQSEARRVSLFKVKCEELLLGTIAVTTKAIGESIKRGSSAPLDLVECLEVCLVCLGNLMSGEGWQVENRRYESVTKKKIHEPVLEAMATYPKNSSMQFSCLVSLSNICMGSGTGADMVINSFISYIYFVWDIQLFKYRFLFLIKKMSYYYYYFFSNPYML